jgi:hypothetical protein
MRLHREDYACGCLQIPIDRKSAVEHDHNPNMIQPMLLNHGLIAPFRNGALRLEQYWSRA